MPLKTAFRQANLTNSVEGVIYVKMRGLKQAMGDDLTALCRMNFRIDEELIDIDKKLFCQNLNIYWGPVENNLSHIFL